MARQPLHSENHRTDQPDPLVGDLADREPEIITADPSVMNNDYQDELSFFAEWVTIRLEPSGAENAPDSLAVWVNGRGAECLVNGRSIAMTHLPVGPEITVRRSVIEVIARSKTMRVQTDHSTDITRQLANKVARHVSQTQPFSIIHDPSPRGRAWVAEMLRRTF
jgi:hypothetical protein